MYVMTPFDRDECSKNPFLMQLYNMLVNKTQRPCRTKEHELVIDKQALYDKGKRVIEDNDKGKKKMYHNIGSTYSDTMESLRWVKAILFKMWGNCHNKRACAQRANTKNVEVHIISIKKNYLMIIYPL